MYDRYSSPWNYSLWYHLRRLNGLLDPMASEWGRNKASPDFIVDFGCGTGAVLWTAALIYVGLSNEGDTIIPPKVINIDNSPFMLRYGQFLWNQFQKHYLAAEEIEVEFGLRSWNAQTKVDLTGSWIFANYLFDAKHDRKEICTHFARLIESSKPSRVFLRSSNQPKKRETLMPLQGVAGRRL